MPPQTNGFAEAHDRARVSKTSSDTTAGGSYGKRSSSCLGLSCLLSSIWIALVSYILAGGSTEIRPRGLDHAQATDSHGFFTNRRLGLVLAVRVDTLPGGWQRGVCLGDQTALAQ